MSNQEFREALCRRFFEASSLTKTLSDREKTRRISEWRERFDPELAKLGEIAQRCVNYLAEPDSEVDVARGKFYTLTKTTHPYLISLINSLPELSERARASDNNDKHFREFMEFLALLAND